MRTSPKPSRRKPSQEELFRKFGRMIWQFAYRNKWAYNDDVEESYADHCLAFCEAHRRWRPEHAEFSTVLYHHLRVQALRNIPVPEVLVSLDGLEPPAPNGDPEHYATLNESLRGMSLEGRILSSIALDQSTFTQPKQRYARDTWAVRARAERMGIAPTTMHKAWREVRQAVTA